MSTPILKTLVADPDNVVDFSKHKPGLTGEALKIWKALANEHPYWWSESDLLTVERYCLLVAVNRSINKDYHKATELADKKTLFAMLKASSIEMKAAEYSLGLTPQGRAALKLKDPSNQKGREQEAKKKGAAVVKPSDL